MLMDLRSLGPTRTFLWWGGGEGLEYLGFVEGKEKTPLVTFCRYIVSQT